MHRIFLVLFLFTACNENTTQGSPVKKRIAQPASYDSVKKISKRLYTETKKHPSAVSILKFSRYITDTLIPYWYGTKWDFNGTSETPGEGAVACGYFVTTVVRDAGIPVNRVKMAQCASETMIRTLCEPASIRRFRGQEFTSFIQGVSGMKKGLYIIGLDNHTGFINIRDDRVDFIHASYIQPGCVIQEDAAAAILLKQSNYKVIGKVRI